jgi:hypothetical protein
MTKAGLVRDGHFGGFETIEGPPPESACHPAQTDGVAPACAYGRSTASVSRIKSAAAGQDADRALTVSRSQWPSREVRRQLRTTGHAALPPGLAGAGVLPGLPQRLPPWRIGRTVGAGLSSSSCLRAREIAIPAALAPGGT